MRSAKQLRALAAPTSRPKPKPRTPADELRIYGPPEFREWIHALPCEFCLIWGFTEQAHAQGDGTARKADWTLSLPACGPHPHKDAAGLSEGCHRRIHRVGVKTFEKALGVSLLEIAAEVQRRWRAFAGLEDGRGERAE